MGAHEHSHTTVLQARLTDAVFGYGNAALRDWLAFPGGVVECVQCGGLLPSVRNCRCVFLENPPLDLEAFTSTRRDSN